MENFKEKIPTILGVIILFFFASFFIHFLLFIIIAIGIYQLYKAVKPYIKNFQKPKKTKNGKIIIEAKYKEK